MDILKAYQVEILLGLVVVVVLQLFFILALSGRLNRQSRSIRNLLTGPTGEDLEQMLTRCLHESAAAIKRGDDLEAQQSELGEQIRGCVQHIGLIRYDAYNDISGQQSFSFALLNGRQDGAIITGLFGRHDGRCYGKAVAGGRTEQALSEEEVAALQAALQGGSSNPTLNGKSGRRIEAR